MAAQAGFPEQKAAESGRRGRPLVLLTIVLVIATAGLVYELCMAAVASYVLGDSVRQFSIVIGLYLSALGLGAYLSRYIVQRLELTFVDVELSAALLGGFSAPALLLAYDHTSYFHALLYLTVLLVGTLVGLELPLLMRILRQQLEFKDLIAKALTFDYAGALLGSLGFSLLLVPKLGLLKSSLVCGLLNAGVGLVSTWVLAAPGRQGAAWRAARLRAVIVLVLLGLGLVQSGALVARTEARLFGGRVLVAEHSEYQRILLVERSGAIELYLNGNLQFSSRDEHRYHEALVHPAMLAAASRARILIGGGGDGLAVREVLKWPEVTEVTLVDLDARITELAQRQPDLVRQNRRALFDPRVRVVNDDAMRWFAGATDAFDVVILDFPDPTNYSLGKLYSTRFFASARRLLAPGGALVVQSTSPLFAPAAFWCVEHTLRQSGFFVRPYHVFVPSFGEWGFLLAKREDFQPPGAVPALDLRYLDGAALRAAFAFPADMQRRPTEPNRLDNQALVNYYVSEWERWN